MKSFRDIRVIPVVLVAICGFAVLKIAGLVIDGGYVFDYQPQSTKPSWAQETLNFPTGRTEPPKSPVDEPNDITGSVDEKPKEGRRQARRRRAGSGQARRHRAVSGAGPAGIAVRARHSGAAASRGGRNSKRARAKSIFAKACSRPPKSASNRRSRN